MSRLTKYFKNERTKLDFAISLCFCVLSVPAVSLIISILLTMTKNPTALINVCSLASTVICALASGLFVSRYKKAGGIGYSAIIILCTVIIMIICALIINKGRIYPSAMMNYGCYVGIAMLSAYFGKNRLKRKKRKR